MMISDRSRECRPSLREIGRITSISSTGCRYAFDRMKSLHLVVDTGGLNCFNDVGASGPNGVIVCVNWIISDQL